MSYKSLTFLLVAVLLVACFSVTCISAVSFPDYTVTGGATVSFSDVGFSVSGNGATGRINFTGVRSASGRVIVNSSLPSSGGYTVAQWNWNGGTNSNTVSNISGGLVSSGNSSTTLNIYMSQGSDTGFFEFECSTTDNSGVGPSLSFYNVYAGGSVNTTEYIFDSLVINGVTIIESSRNLVIPFSLLPGYSLIIDGACDIIGRSYSINNSWNFSPSNSHRVNGSSERILSSAQIVDGFSPDKNLSITSLIQWNPLNSNLFGVASSYDFSASDNISLSSGASFVLSYPAFFGTNGVLDNYFNNYNVSILTGTISLTYSGSFAPSVRYVAIESLGEFSPSREYFTYSVFRPSVYDGTGSQVSVGETITVLPDSSMPSDGGNTGQPPLDNDGSIIALVQRFVNRVKSLFNSVGDAITTLFNGGSSFMSRLADIFSWLPEPVSAILVSALIVVIVVGLIKLFM